MDGNIRAVRSYSFLACKSVSSNICLSTRFSLMFKKTLLILGIQSGMLNCYEYC